MPVINAEYCIQEFANETSSCKGVLSTGNYNFSNNANDGDYSTKDTTTLPDYRINYSKPASAVNSSLWQVAYDDQNNQLVIQNLTLPIDCFNQTPIQFKINRTSNFIQKNIYWMCFNGTSNNFINVSVGNGGEVGAAFFEEAMWWNMSNPRATNVSITPIPITQNQQLKGHANYSNDGFVLGGNQTYWYVNKTLILEANNSFTLLGGNTTESANITFSARFNDTYVWGDWVNSSTITVGDATPPSITNQSINGNSFTTDQRINVSLTCIDALGTIQYARVEWNRTGSFANDTMSSLGNSVFAYDNVFSVGKFNATNFYCADGSSNIQRDLSNFTFTVTSPSGDSGGGSGGGGGGGSSDCPTGFFLNSSGVCSNATTTKLIQTNCNFNNVCEGKNGEDPFSCPTDCKINTNYITCDDPTQRCVKDLFAAENVTVRLIILITLIALLIVLLPKESGLGKIFKGKKQR